MTVMRFAGAKRISNGLVAPRNPSIARLFNAPLMIDVSAARSAQWRFASPLPEVCRPRVWQESFWPPPSTAAFHSRVFRQWRRRVFRKESSSGSDVRLFVKLDECHEQRKDERSNEHSDEAENLQTSKHP